EPFHRINKSEQRAPALAGTFPCVAQTLAPQDTSSGPRQSLGPSGGGPRDSALERNGRRSRKNTHAVLRFHRELPRLARTHLAPAATATRGSRFSLGKVSCGTTRGRWRRRRIGAHWQSRQSIPPCYPRLAL